VATAEIEKTLSRLPHFANLLGEDLVAGYIRNWGAAIAYYAEDFHFDRMRRTTSTPASVSVVVPASGPQDDALIQVTCLARSDSTWHVLRIEFITESATAAAASQPAPEP
jgi:hypothetical protein